MSEETLRYDTMVEGALRGVVRQALREAAENGLPGNHHFYLTFRSTCPGVELPGYLRAQYPNEMTIVLQYQYFGLEVQDDVFAVTLSFNGAHERLVVPFAAISTFADPSVNFALQFQPLSAKDAADVEPEPASADAAEAGKPEEPAKRGQVVALDAFRKK